MIQPKQVVNTPFSFTLDPQNECFDLKNDRNGNFHTCISSDFTAVSAHIELDVWDISYVEGYPEVIRLTGEYINKIRLVDDGFKVEVGIYDKDE